MHRFIRRILVAILYDWYMKILGNVFQKIRIDYFSKPGSADDLRNCAYSINSRLSALRFQSYEKLIFLCNSTNLHRFV